MAWYTSSRLAAGLRAFFDYVLKHAVVQTGLGLQFLEPFQLLGVHAAVLVNIFIFSNATVLG